MAPLCRIRSFLEVVRGKADPSGSGLRRAICSRCLSQMMLAYQKTTAKQNLTHNDIAASINVRNCTYRERSRGQNIALLVSTAFFVALASAIVSAGGSHMLSFSSKNYRGRSF
jgi:hypothetical protein